MKVFNTYADIPSKGRGAVLVIGNFDGVHRGHLALLEKGQAIAEKKGVPLGVLTFEPHPHRLFQPDTPPSRITPESVKAWRLELAGTDILFSLPFNWDFASRSAADFIQHVLIAGLDASHIVVGYDFRFGQLRKGVPADIEAAGLPVTIVEEIADEAGAAISSSRIRQALRHGKIEEANALLGWDWEIRGEVIKGDRRGHELGFPTANTALGDTLHPAYGVYAVRACVQGEDCWYQGAANIGIRPMFEVETAQLETHIFDFDEDIYGKTLRVQPVYYLRGEAKFDSLEALIAQMESDCAQARTLLAGV
ncbi:MAG: bifunctional riboflavin kinase/FAD synthetase [Alphaproteobacteria bacterium]|nr:bifunctional riboflavin kinase/FAD synthetase [Alphaproteobacteria bacterium]